MSNTKIFCNKMENFDRFVEEDSYIVLLRLNRLINNYADQLKTLKDEIAKLEIWKEQGVYSENEKHPIFWNFCRTYDKYMEEMSLEEAKKAYTKIKIKYDTLLELFTDTKNISYKDNQSGLIDKYFTDIENI